MKKLILLLCFVSYCLLSNAQELTAPSSTTSGSEVTITASGESDMAYFSSISYDPTLTSTTPSNQQGWISANFIQYEQQYNIVSRQPTKFKMKMTNGFNQAISATFGFRCVQYSTSPGASPVNVVKYLTITVNPAPVQTVFKNASKSQVFTKNDCGAGTTGTQVTYTVPANKYSSTISQADADSKAQNDINNNGQAYANANGQCLTIYYNAEISGSFTKNDCNAGFSGSSVAYTIVANQYQSTISQADADSKAQAALLANGQANANNLGTCFCAGPPSSPIFSRLTYKGKNQHSILLQESSGTSFNWYLDEVFLGTTTTPNYTITVACGVSKLLGVEAVNSCGISTRSYRSMTGCQSGFDE